MSTEYAAGYTVAGGRQHAIYALGVHSRGGWSRCRNQWCEKTAARFDPDRPDACKVCARIVRGLRERPEDAAASNLSPVALSSSGYASQAEADGRDLFGEYDGWVRVYRRDQAMDLTFAEIDSLTEFAAFCRREGKASKSGGGS